MFCKLINDAKKNPLVLFISITVVVAIGYYYFYGQENMTSETSSESKPHSIIKMGLYGCSVMMCSMILPLIIMYFITKSSAKAAIRDVVPSLLTSALSGSPSESTTV
jgi:branched-subunit amino acid ABC-type transport system permease component